jgi:hypothetical protein
MTNAGPARAIGGEPASGDQAVQVDMRTDLLAPGVQHGQEPTCAPRWRESAAMVSRVSATSRNRRLKSTRGFCRARLAKAGEGP